MTSNSFQCANNAFFNIHWHARAATKNDSKKARSSYLARTRPIGSSHAAGSYREQTFVFSS